MDIGGIEMQERDRDTNERTEDPRDLTTVRRTAIDHEVEQRRSRRAPILDFMLAVSRLNS